MDTALEKDSGSTGRDGLRHLVRNLRKREDISVVCLFRAIKRTESAAIDAHVGVVDVAVDDVGSHTLIGLSPPDGIRRLPEREQISMGKKLLDFLALKPFAPHRSFENLGNCHATESLLA